MFLFSFLYFYHCYSSCRHTQKERPLMSTNSPFISPADAYVREIDLVRHYIHDQASHLSVMTGIDMAEATAFVKTKLRKDGEFPLQDPTAVFLERDFETGDRSQNAIPMSEYINDILQMDNIFAPTFTTYLPPKVRVSPLSVFQQTNVNDRGIAKKEKFRYELEEGENSFNFKFKDGEQTTKKLANNAVSGSHISEHNPLFNKTAHSALTSACRQTSAYGNANNERFLASNRHYWSYKTTKNNLISIVSNTDLVAFEAVMEKYQLYYPTNVDVMNVILRSAKLYWNDKKSVEQLRFTVSKFTKIQRAAFVYTGDMHQLKELNNDFVRGFIGRIIEFVDVVDPTPAATIKKWPEDFLNLAKQICTRFMKGKTVDKVKKEEPENYGRLASVTDNIGMTLYAYSDLIKIMWATNNVPASVARFPDSLRRVVLVSDTDSTIFTTQDWIHWYCGKVEFNETADAVTSTMIFLASQSIIHILAKMSANVGIERDHAFTIAMKNEYKFDIFVLTQLGKHYFAQIGAQEGNIYEKFKTEIKGVHLKSSNVPKEVVKKAEAMMVSIMNTVQATGQVSAYEKAKEVADYEREILASIQDGKFRFLKLATVKSAESYKQGASASNYRQYGMWNEVFGPKYGFVQPPPYRVIQVSLELDSKTKMNEWLASLADQELAERMRRWLAANNRDKLTSLLLPVPIIASKGIPEEIMTAINTRKIIQKATAIFYLILETLGLYFNHSDLTQLVSDRY